MPCFKSSCSMAHACMDRWSHEAREGGTCRVPGDPGMAWGCGLNLHSWRLPLTLEPLSLSPCLGVRFGPLPLSPPHRALLFCRVALWVICFPSILTLSSAPDQGQLERQASALATD